MNSFSKDHIDPKILSQWTSKKQDSRTLVVFGVLSIFFTIFGLLFVIAGSRINEYSVEYTDDPSCVAGPSCSVTLDIKKRMEGPVYLYIRIAHFYQNHQRYTNSRDDEQLRGVNKPVSQLGDCHPFITNEQAGLTQSMTGAALVGSDPAIPCGLMALTMFTDEITIENPSGSPVDISTDGIAWDIDSERFKNTDDLSKQWYDMQDPRFWNWMRPAGLHAFRKLWGVINQDLEAGQYTINIEKNIHSTTFRVEKYGTENMIILSTMNRFGGQNLLLSVCYLIAAAMSWIVFIIFVIRTIKNRRKNH